MNDFSISLVEPTVRWRDLFALEFSNANLQRRVETFMDLLERTAFGFDIMDAQTGAIQAEVLTGQSLLGRIADIKQLYEGSAITEILAKHKFTRDGNSSSVK